MACPCGTRASRTSTGPAGRGRSSSGAVHRARAERAAIELLRGVGAGDDMRELGHVAIHVRRLVSPAERARLGGAVDVRCAACRTSQVWRPNCSDCEANAMKEPTCLR